MTKNVFRFTLAVLTLSTAVTAFGRGATPKELVIDLKFKPQEGVTSHTAEIPPSMAEKTVEIRIVDKRNESDPKVIGTGTGGDDKSFPIKASLPIDPYIKDTLNAVAKDFGLKVVEKGGARVLVVDVNKFHIDESNKALGSVYTANVKLGYTLKNGSKTLTEGADSGEAHRYGRAHSAENMNEVLSDALKEAFANVLNESRLQDAWSGKK